MSPPKRSPAGTGRRDEFRDESRHVFWPGNFPGLKFSSTLEAMPGTLAGSSAMFLGGMVGDFVSPRQRSLAGTGRRDESRDESRHVFWLVNFSWLEVFIYSRGDAGHCGGVQRNVLKGGWGFRVPRQKEPGWYW